MKASDTEGAHRAYGRRSATKKQGSEGDGKKLQVEGSERSYWQMASMQLSAEAQSAFSLHCGEASPALTQKPAWQIG